MLPDRVSNPGPLTYESDALAIALRGPAAGKQPYTFNKHIYQANTETKLLDRRTIRF